jgi:hypothetical protein
MNTTAWFPENVILTNSGRGTRGRGVSTMAYRVATGSKDQATSESNDGTTGCTDTPPAPPIFATMTSARFPPYRNSGGALENFLDIYFCRGFNTAHLVDSSRNRLRCCTEARKLDPFFSVYRAKGDKLVTEIEELKDRIEVSTKSDNTSTLVLKEAKDSDAGNYTCSLYDGDSKMASDTIRVAATTTGKWGLRVNKNVNVVEGEKLTLKCEVKGDLKLDWLYSEFQTKTKTKGGWCTGRERIERLRLFS